MSAWEGASRSPDSGSSARTLWPPSSRRRVVEWVNGALVGACSVPRSSLPGRHHKSVLSGIHLSSHHWRKEGRRKKGLNSNRFTSAPTEPLQQHYRTPITQAKTAADIIIRRSYTHTWSPVFLWQSLCVEMVFVRQPLVSPGSRCGHHVARCLGWYLRSEHQDVLGCNCHLLPGHSG